MWTVFDWATGYEDGYHDREPASNDQQYNEGWQDGRYDLLSGNDPLCGPDCNEG